MIQYENPLTYISAPPHLGAPAHQSPTLLTALRNAEKINEKDSWTKPQDSYHIRYVQYGRLKTQYRSVEYRGGACAPEHQLNGFVLFLSTVKVFSFASYLFNPFSWCRKTNPLSPTKYKWITQTRHLAKKTNFDFKLKTS